MLCAESMASFPALIELEMPLNDIYNVTITQGQFETLEVCNYTLCCSFS